jgi:4-hydroxyproline epimerase
MKSTGRTTRIDVIDSHTAGEPTRLVTGGGPDLGGGSLQAQLERLRSQHDGFRSAVVNEPRGSDVLVGALLCEPEDRSCAAGVIFFNNVGYLGMCGHGTIGLMVSLAHMGKIDVGTHRIETPVGVITATLHGSGRVSVENVRSYRSRKNVSVTVADYGEVSGDVAWGGNWFYLIEEHSLPLRLQDVDRLTDFTWAVRNALAAKGVTGDNGGMIDHIEMFGPPSNGHADSRNFVLCPGKAYDRSPCGTGTSAKMACMVADGKLRPGQTWRQEGILGTVFEGTIEAAGDGVMPTITGEAYITAECSLILDAEDPFRMGIVS